MFQGIALNNFYKVEENHVETEKIAEKHEKRVEMAKMRVKGGKMAKMRVKGDKMAKKKCMKGGKMAKNACEGRENGQKKVQKGLKHENKLFYYPFFYFVIKRRVLKLRTQVVKMKKIAFWLPQKSTNAHEKTKFLMTGVVKSDKSSILLPTLRITHNIKKEILKKRVVKTRKTPIFTTRSAKSSILRVVKRQKRAFWLPDSAKTTSKKAIKALKAAYAPTKVNFAAVRRQKTQHRQCEKAKKRKSLPGGRLLTISRMRLPTRVRPYNKHRHRD